MTNIEHISLVIRTLDGGSRVGQLGVCPDHGLTVVREGGDLEDAWVCMVCELIAPCPVNVITHDAPGLVDTATPYRVQ